jgi:hypothetical protein
MTDKSNDSEIPLYDQSGVKCPKCDTVLPKSLFMRFIKTNFIRYFLFIFCLAFSLITIIIDIRSHYQPGAAANSSYINPYQIALIFSGALSLIGWLGQKQNDLRKELASKGQKKTNE